MDNNTKDKRELEKVMEEVNNKKVNIPKQKDSKNEKEKILDEELEIIREKIKNSNPKWKLENFDEFFYKGYSKATKANVIKVKIYGKEEYKTLIRISKKLQDKDNNFVFELLSKRFYKFVGFSKILNKEKVDELMKSYIFYSNTKYENQKLKFTNEKLPIWFYVFLLIIVSLGVIGGMIVISSVYFGILYTIAHLL